MCITLLKLIQYLPILARVSCVSETDRMCCTTSRYRSQCPPAHHFKTKRSPAGKQRLSLDFVLAREAILAIDWPPRAASTEDACRLSTVTEKNTAQVNCELELF